MKNVFINDIDKIKDIIQDSNLNFLIGSGASVPYFDTLGNIELWLTELEKIPETKPEVKAHVKASIYNSYFNVAIADNHFIRDFVPPSTKYVRDPKQKKSKLRNTYLSYKYFLSAINELVYERRSNTISKHVNIFTTNIDVFLEKLIEDVGLQYNDGFYGIFNRKFNLSNYRRSYFRKSLQYDNVSELPVFNLLKVHGSVNWIKNGENIEFDNLNLINEIKKARSGTSFIDIKSANNKSWEEKSRPITANEIYNSAASLSSIPDCSAFIKKYDQLQIVNPTKEKFRDTTFNKNYYEMLRLYSNELEKEATSLFIIGFSLADEHIREITIRAIKSNPTLFVFICSYTTDADDIISNLKKDDFEIENHQNVRIINFSKEFDLRKVNYSLFQQIVNKIKEVKSGK